MGGWPKGKPRAPEQSRWTPLSERFWAQVLKTDGCWLWTGRRDGVGYGTITHGRRRIGSHRLAYELQVGPIPSGLWVLHRCDVRLCVRPDHLFVGTHTDNMRDCVSKGRHRHQEYRGESNPEAKLTWAQVERIRELYAVGRSPVRGGRGRYRQIDIAQALGVSKAAVANVTYGRAWTTK